MAEMVRAHVIVSGQVQGVFFRESTRREAEAAGITGWVRNLSDGSVEAVFEGEAQAVEALLAYVQRGPEHATVTKVEVTKHAHVGEFEKFTVLRKG